MLLLNIGVHVGGVNATQEIDVFVRMELGHFTFGGWFGTLYDRERDSDQI